jgi:hypothetical protein
MEGIAAGQLQVSPFYGALLASYYAGGLREVDAGQEGWQLSAAADDHIQYLIRSGRGR